MNRILCRLFGHNWKVYHRKKSRTGPELNEFKKCKRCKHTEKMTFAMIHEERVREVAMGDLVCTDRTISIPQMDKVTADDLKGESGYSVVPILRDMVRKGENYTTHTREKGRDK